jgi:cytochrome c oxidase assembly protein subunit 15
MTTGAVYIQLILGAIMRHTESGLAVPDFPLAYGQLFPSLSPEALAQYNQQLIQSDIRIAADGAITSTQIMIHMIHRLWAVIVSIMIAWTSIRLFKLSSVSKRISRFALVLLGLLAAQITLGALTVLSGKEIYIATAHVAIGSLLLVSCVLLSIHAMKLFGFRQRRSAMLSYSTRGVTA